MELNYTIYTLFNTVGIIQALTLGMSFLILSKKKHRNIFYLGVFLILYAFLALPFILEDTGFYNKHPNLYLLPIDTYWFLFPVFYAYTREVSILPLKTKQHWFYYPGIAALVLQLIIFFLPYETKILVKTELPYMVYIIAKYIYSWAIGAYTLIHINKHKIEVNNYFSKKESNELEWAKIFLICNMVGTMLFLVLCFVYKPSVVAKLFYSVFNLILIYWISYHGIKQRSVHSLVKEPTTFKLNTEIDKPSPKRVDADTKALMKEIEKAMVTNENYINDELTIVDIADVLNTHHKKVSAAINQVKNLNFNAYVNQFRIQKAKELLSDHKNEHLTIEGIGREVGFKSKSAFYTSFKKETGMTPKAYKSSSE